MLYTPAPLVVVGIATPVAVFVAVTVAPATTAPCESVTVPVMFARPDWANTPGVPIMRNNAAIASIAVKLLVNSWFHRTFFVVVAISSKPFRARGFPGRRRLHVHSLFARLDLFRFHYQRKFSGFKRAKHSPFKTVRKLLMVNKRCQDISERFPITSVMPHF